VLLLAAAADFCPQNVLAADPVLVDATDLRSTSVEVVVRGKAQSRDVFCLGKVAGTASKRGAQFRFSSFASQIKSLRKSNPQSPKLPLLRALLVAGKAACSALPVAPPTASPVVPPGATAAPPTATAIPTSTPTAVATATPGSSNFDALGNVTEKGKVTFGIPSQLSGNVTTGKNVSRSFCSGCHSEKVNRTYPELDAAIRKSPMLYDESNMTRQELADIVAYLNRFRT
jgi:hypothetical protein